jgi:hypothetical protein
MGEIQFGRQGAKEARGVLVQINLVPGVEESHKFVENIVGNGAMNCVLVGAM